MDSGKEGAAIRAGCGGLERKEGQDGDSLRVDERLRRPIGHCSYEHVKTLRLRCSQNARSSAAAFSNPQLRYAEYMGPRLRHEMAPAVKHDRRHAVRHTAGIAGGSAKGASILSGHVVPKPCPREGGLRGSGGGSSGGGGDSRGAHRGEGVVKTAITVRVIVRAMSEERRRGGVRA